MESRDRLRAATLVAVIRDSDPVRAAKLVEGLIEGGLRALEVTANTPGAFELVERLGPWTERAGITLVALARPDRFEAFTHTDRIVTESAHVGHPR